LESKGKAWMAASAGMLALAIITAASPLISSAIVNRPLSEPYGQIPTQGTCSEKLLVYLNSHTSRNAISTKTVRDYFEQQTGCVVEKTPLYSDWTRGNYAVQHFPQVKDISYSVTEVTPYRVGGSYGSIPAWKVIIELEVEIEDLPGWGLCEPGLEQIVFSGDWVNPDWPSTANQSSRNGYIINEWAVDAAYMSRYSVSFQQELQVTDASGFATPITLYTCGYDPIFQNAASAGYSPLEMAIWLDPADLPEIPFYNWMGW
jgi:hypothetical protein